MKLNRAVLQDGSRSVARLDPTASALPWQGYVAQGLRQQGLRQQGLRQRGLRQQGLRQPGLLQQMLPPLVLAPLALLMLASGCGEPNEIKPSDVGAADTATTDDAGAVADTGSSQDDVSSDTAKADIAAHDGGAADVGADVSGDPGLKTLCDPCTLSSQCGAAGDASARCVDHDGNGAFCAMACGDADACPLKYTCRSVTTMEGTKASQCVPEGAKATVFGACNCSTEAIKAGKKTSCSVTSSVDGKSVTCYGERACEKVGLSSCTASAPTKEVCDGLDNDCDGSTDGGTCDDGDACTLDICDGKAGKCASKPNAGPCNDDNPCTTGETCSGGACKGGVANACDDKNPCTTDACDKAVGCQHAAIAGCKACTASSQCNDGDACTADACSNKNCSFTPKVCDDNDSCTTDACSPEKGDCTSVFNKSVCSTAKPLSLPFMASFGCGDASAALWTLDKPATAGAPAWGFDDTPALPAPSYKPCSLNFNNGTDFQCTAGATAVSGAAMSPWIDATSVPTAGNLRMRVRFGGTYERNNNDELFFEASVDGKTWTTLYDANGMTTTSQWSEPNVSLSVMEGKIFRVRVRFFTNNCTANTGTGPFIDRVWINDDACYAHDDCTGGSACSVRRCVNQSCQGLNPCNDFNACTSDSCNSADGSCKHGAVNGGKPCEDGDSCTVGTLCTAGVCAGGTTAKDGDVCDDGNGCTPNGVCKGGDCKAAVICDDANTCTVDSCDPLLNKCVFLPASGSCDDDDPCTTKDSCAKGFCAGEAKSCDDSDPCTSDTCAITGGACTHVADTCDDGDSCTIDSCNKASGACSHSADSACAAAAKLPYTQPFDCGGKHSWALTGTSGGPTWAVDATPAVPVPYTGACALNFNNGKDFACPAGATKVEGTATSPWLDATAAQTTYMRLRFRLAGSWESNNDDEFYVEGTTDGTVWQKIWDASNTNTTSWQYPQLGLGQYLGTKFRLRFRFFSADCTDNGGTGPFIDDVRVEDLGCLLDKDCDDGSACTTHSCSSNGYCSNVGKNCNDDNPCTTDTCSAATGACGHTFLADGYGCSDGDVCTVQDKCHSGKCYGVPSACDDGDACTTDLCDVQVGCLYKPVCDDGDGCTLDICDPGTQKCSVKAVIAGAACEDGDACTGGELCGAKGCVGGVVSVSGTNASYSTVSDVAVHSTGAVFFTSIGYHRIYKLEGATAVVIAGTSSGYVDGAGTQARFNSPRSLDVDPAGNLFVADSSNHRIRKVDTKGVVSTLAGSTGGFTEGAAGRLNNPYGVALDSKGTVWVADTYNYRIRRLGGAGSVITIAGSASGGFADGQGAAARFNQPMGIDFDAADALYVADSYNYRIRKVTPTGLVTTVAGSGTNGFIDGPVASARFYRPWDVQVAAGGGLLVADAYNYRVRRITATGLVSTLAGQSSGGYTNGPGVLARFNRPTGIATHKDGTIYVADMYNGRIRTLTVTPGDGATLCDDGNACTIDACDKLAGACSNKAKSSCDDGKACTTDACDPLSGACMNTPVACDDGDSCTVDSCAAATGDCAHVAGTCSDVVTQDGWKQAFTCSAASLQGWTLTGAGGPKWAVDKTPDKPAPVSPDCTLNFNNGTDYTCAAGAKNVEGSATTPWLDTSKMVAGGQVRVQFRYSGRWETNNNDELLVEITTDGTTWSLLADLSWGSSASWGTYNGLRSGVGGGKMKLRFRFVTTDCKLNGWQGAFIDNLVISDESCKAASDCGDGNACTTDSCNSAGACTYGGLSCNDGNACTDDSCSVQWGCQHKVKVDGTLCSDGDTCTTNDSCLQQQCVGVPSGVEGSSCSDSSNCTGGDTCTKGKCVGVSMCHDGNVCTKNGCSSGNCTFTLDPKLCDDGKPCTVDVCDGNDGGCKHSDDACDDGDSCTVDSCDPKSGACTFAKGTCGANDKPTVPWQAGFACDGSGKSQWTLQNVSGGVGWAMDKTPLPPKPYVGDCSLNLNDGTKLSCDAGQTSIVAYAMSPWIDATLIPQLDNQLRARFRATGTMPNTGLIFRLEATLDGKAWTNLYNLGNVGTTTAWYERVASLYSYAGKVFRLRYHFELPCAGLSGSGPFIDALSIRDERCQGDSQCDDGNVCTQNRCLNGACSFPGVTCDDNNPCTSDSCSASFGGCRNIPRADTYACGDTGGCVEHRCLAGACAQQNKTEGQACSDGDTCTSAGKCTSGSCVTTVVGATSAPCSDNDRCTTDDRCGSSGCTGKVGTVTTASGASLSSPGGVALDAQGRVYISSQGHHRIRRFENGTLVDFAGSSGGLVDGPKATARFNQPWGLDVSAKGEVFVADANNHRVRKIDVAGNVTTLAGSGQGFLDGPGASAKFYRPQDVAVDGNGLVYVADTYNNRIRRVATNGVVTTVAGSGATGFADGKGVAAKFYRPGGVALDGAGVLFVADTYNSRIRRVASDGTVTTFSGTGSASHSDGAATVARFNRPFGITWGGGDFYVADYYNHDIRRVDPKGQVSTLTGRQGYGNVDGVLSGARLAYPLDALVDAAGTIYVADGSNSRMRLIKFGGGDLCNDSKACTNDACLTTTGLCDNGPKDCDDGSACTLDTCAVSTGTCAHKTYGCDDGNLCTVDGCDALLGCKHSLKAGCEDCDDASDCDDGKPCTKDGCDAATGCVHPAIAGCLGCTTAASCDDGNSCTVDVCKAGACGHTPALDGSWCSDGSLCTGDDHCQAGQCTGAVATLDYFAGAPGQTGTTDGIGDQARFNVPLGVTWHAGLGQLIVAGGLGHRVRRVLPSGQTVRLSGYNVGYSDGSLTSSGTRYNRPADVAVTPDGIVWVADELNHRLRRLDLMKTNLVSTVAGSGKPGFADGKAGVALLAYPRGVAASEAGMVLVADSGNHRIRQYQPTNGALSTLAGAIAGFADGSGSAAKFSNPTGVDVDSKGRIFVADRGNHRIRRIVSGVVTTVAGGSAGFVDGAGAQARFKSPGDVIVSPAGVLFVADTGNHALRRISPAGQVATVAGGTAGSISGPLALARLNGPEGLALGTDGALWVVEQGSHTVRRLQTTNSLCGDGMTCAGDVCDPKSGACIYAPALGTSGCDDNNPCTADVCLPWSGNCLHAPIPQGTSCGGGAVCDAGACESK